MRRLFLALLLVAATDVPQVLTIGGEPFAQADILDARAVADGTGQPAILITLAPEAATRLKALSSAQVGREVAFAFGDQVLMRPILRETITSGSVEVSGMQSFEAATALARHISGKEPLPESLDE